ncbi:caspase family protein [Telmatospirillum sp.]|uniref:caspase family protein n=1 Tax=Telmatospirillum sp. TaxID=2079197 RepID=UPI002843643D|nr:caspase family protein [Telmatospirillum sp.]MDR3435864.1 caspase family protein [Telmatospirillum sp.]
MQLKWAARIAHRGGILLGLLLAFLAVSALPTAASAEEQAEHRVALVIGNGAYRNASPLANPPHDAELIGETLKQLGFTLVGGAPLVDADKPAMESAIREFGRQLQEGAVGLFYYSGHGIQVGGTNYLIPISANIASDVDVKYELVDVGFVLDEMTHANNRLNIVILDACRNNPFGRKSARAMSSGLGQVLAPAGTVIGYATQPDNVAADGTGRNSPYTTALATSLQKPGLDLFGVFNDVGIQVKQVTGGQQQPWLSASPIEGKFFFAGEPEPGAAGVDPDALFWDSIKASTNGEDFQNYLAKFPNGKFADLAKRKLLSDCDKLAASPTDPDRLGDGVAPAAMDSHRAITACKAVSGSQRADYLLGRAYEAANQFDAAAGAYKSSADQGYGPAQSALAALYDTGHGVPADPAQAVAWHRKAAAQGLVASELALADHLASGRGIAKDEAESLRWYRKAAEQGAAPAAAVLGQVFATGRGVGRDDAEAVRWYRKAAEQGVASAQTRLGEAYSEGVGIGRDANEAAKWYRKAAEQGDAAAEYDLGWCYQFGIGVAADAKAAVSWYRKAADQGYAKAKTALASLTGSSD